ncbi:lysin A [Mycobacterium phage DirkDirk]|uniref:Lysin A n=1 Tax=Mycobacterium phage DirkDirk TaxID=2664225 RepID=A0A5Q2W9D4_9CAUD|nr:endolysin [Mycobacterium phage DirkDirk]ASR86008.1 lysin A [Mycobacterium phage Appletree2]QGH75136.1 lysin A [Mycobacterium phage DirkDirk]
MALLGSLTADSSFDDVGEAIVRECLRRGYPPTKTIACVSTAIQESYLRPRARSANGLWVGIYQQDTSYPKREDPNENIREFLNRLDVKCASAGASPDPWKNIFWLQQRPGEKSAEDAYRNGRQAYLTEIKSRVNQATVLFEKYSGGEVIVAERPDFNEYAIWSPNRSSRNGVKPTMFLLHTQEGSGNADSLAKYFTSANQVSYHYTISKGANDDGVTVVDCVDTDYAAWSVGNANSRSINLCFAGSFASWTREQWLAKAGRAIDVAAYLAVQDAKKYGFSTLVVPPPYSNGTPGISDHRWVTDVFKWGTHTDVGPGFPWDVLAASVAKYTGQAQAPAAPSFAYPSTDVMIREIWEQLRGPQGKGWPQLGKNARGENLTLVDAIAELKAAS